MSLLFHQSSFELHVLNFWQKELQFHDWYEFFAIQKHEIFQLIQKRYCNLYSPAAISQNSNSQTSSNVFKTFGLLQYHPQFTNLASWSIRGYQRHLLDHSLSPQANRPLVIRSCCHNHQSWQRLSSSNPSITWQIGC